MAFDFNFTKETIKKADFFIWLVDKLTSHGWEYVNESRPQDYYVFSSKGESGEDNIMFQVKTHYGSYTARAFHNSGYAYLAARPIHSYKPASTATGVGGVLPNVDYTEFRLQGGNDVGIEEVFDIYYHVNKDRIIIVSNSPLHTLNIGSYLCILGKPYTLAKYNEYNTSAVITLNPNTVGVCQSGVINRNPKERVELSTLHYLNPLAYQNSNNTFASEVALHNAYDGLKYIIENVLVSNIRGKRGTDVFEVNMREDIYIDNEGNKYVMLPLQNTSNSADTNIRTMFLKVGNV